MSRLASSLGIPDEIALGLYIVTCGYLPIPVFNLIPKSWALARHMFSIVAAIALYVSLMSVSDLLELLAMCTVVYVTALFKNKKWMPILVFCYVMGHYCFRTFHIQVMEKADNKAIDPSTPMMLSVIRLTTFAWNIHDSFLAEKDIIPELKPFVVKEFPSFLEFIGYATFFPTFIIGPALDFTEYKDFMEGADVFQNTPSNFIPTISCLGTGIFFCGLYGAMSDKYNYHFVGSPDFLTWTFFQRFLYVQIAGFSTRIKYYGVFKMAEGACNMIGIGYSGDGTWKRAQGVSISDVEFAQNFKQLFDFWNMKTARWLRNCVYLRMTKPGQKPGGVVTWVTFMVSALWHGFHPGYYLTFGMGALFPILGRSGRKYLRPLFLAPSKLAPMKAIYDFLGWVFTWTSLNCISIPFIVWDLDKSLAAWRSVGYYSLVLLAVGYVFLEGLSGGIWANRTIGSMVGAKIITKSCGKKSL